MAYIPGPTPLIDQFAGHALSGLLANPGPWEAVGRKIISRGTPSPKELAKLSYEIAEAMLEYSKSRK